MSMETATAGVCMCDGTRHQPDRQWTRGNPHTRFSIMLLKTVGGTSERGVPYGLCALCDDGRCEVENR